MSLAQIFALVQQVLNALLVTLGVVQSLEAKQTSVESIPYATQVDADLARAMLENSGFGLAVLATRIEAVRYDAASPHLATITDVLDALAAAPLITLPTVPPPGYGFNGLVYVPQMCSLD
jgi:hypothetical protein